MTSAGRIGLFIFSMIAAVASPRAQVKSQPTPVPIVTAESERWYLAGQPITHAGHFYYPSGAQIHFNASEMVRSGFYEGIPLYARTTLEPYSIVFIPLRGGIMQPYERRRDGDLAGTAGSTTPSLSAASTADENADRSPQAAGPPTLVGNADRATPRPVSAVATVGSSGDAAPAPVSTSGRASRRPSHVVVGPKPQGVNAIFVDFDGRRWYFAGPAVAFDPALMTRIGERHGFLVFADTMSPGKRIYIQVMAGGSMVAPYSISRPSVQEP
ncbi:MAG: hypothetical protein ABIS06_12915 [Vicinamibacterales bacterium]